MPDTQEIKKEEIDSQPQREEKGERQFSEFEQICLKRGWNPDGKMNALEWDENGWKVKQNKVDSLFATIDKLKNKMEQQEKDAYAKALADLEYKRVEAIEMADVERVKELEEQKKSLIDPSVKEHIDAFITKHQAWYKGTSFRDREMQLVCNNKDVELGVERLPPQEHFNKLEEFMKNKYPDYFVTEPLPAANAVEGGQSQAVKSGTKKKVTFDDLDDIQKEVATRLHKSGKMTIEDYIKRAISLGTLGK